MKTLLVRLALAAGMLLFPLTARAQVSSLPAPPARPDTEEQITSFTSAIRIFPDAHLEVTEYIAVSSTGDQIKHGIYRDFPTVYRDNHGQRHIVGFAVTGVTRDGKTEPFHLDRAGNGVRIYAGDENTLVTAGPHEYAITYRADRELGFFTDHDELYWNVTGNGWVFPIGSAKAHVTLPEGIPVDKISTALYTGLAGSTVQNGVAQTAASTADFQTNGPLQPYEGLTIVVGWPKGFVTPPTAAQNFMAQVSANRDYLIGILGLLVVLGYYLLVWSRFGRDPRKGTVIPQYEAPQGLSPAFLRYVRRMGMDNRAFAAALINMAVKRRLAISEDKGFFGSKNYSLTKQAGPFKSGLQPEEQILYEKLFAGGDAIELKKANAAVISGARSDFAASLGEQAGKKYFARNFIGIMAGLLLSLGFFILTIMAASTVRAGIESGYQVVFWVILVVALLVINIVFFFLLPAYTAEGRTLVDESEGFKLFLSVTEKDRLAFHNPPDRTPELFERMLPYALALGVEHQWAQQFADVFARLAQQGTGYVPLWYLGHSFGNFSPDSFAGEIGQSFTGVVSSAASPPGSGSGFGGGGFSGGGGGGGGGGGW